MFCKSNTDGYTKILDGIGIRTLTYGDTTLFAEFKLEKGSFLPSHSHPNEQTGYLIKGKILLTIGNDKEEMNPGDCWCIKENIEHSAQILENSVAIEVFSPVREDYKKYKI